MKHFIILIFSFFLFTNCSSDDSDDTSTNDDSPEQVTPPEEGSEETPPPTTTPVMTPTNSIVTYEKDIAPLISEKCFMCHNSPIANGAPIDATFIDFETVRDFASAINFRVGNGTMPNAQGGGPLPTEQRKLIDDWVQGGMLEN